MDTEIKKAQDRVLSVAWDEDVLHIYHMREKAIEDFNSDMRASEEKGREEGDWERCTISAINLRHAGFSAKEIAGFIGRTVEDVNKIPETIETGTEIKKAQEDTMSVARREAAEAARAALSRKMAILDYNSSIAAAERRGIAEGIAEGIKKSIKKNRRSIEDGIIEDGIKAGIEIGLKKGIQEGMATGKKKGIAISVINLKRAGFPAEEIANFIGETVEDINEILEHDEEAAHAALLRKMAILDYNNGIYVTKERGKKDGDWKRSIIIAINLKQAGFSAKEIAGFIGRTVEDVNKIFEEQGLT